jgi:hypothetical protein
VSITSAAPSYHSDVPDYEQPAPVQAQRSQPQVSQLASGRLRGPQQEQQQYGLPSLRYAPGFVPRTSSRDALSAENYNVVSWSTIRINPVRKQYENVARRRASRAGQIDASTLMNTLLSVATGQGESAAASALSGSSNLAPCDGNPVGPPLPPNEDPDLVGQAAAERAKAQRQYRETLMREDEEAKATALRLEGNSWDFMLRQMNDFEDRDRTQRSFKIRTSVGIGWRLGGRSWGRF